MTIEKRSKSGLIERQTAPDVVTHDRPGADDETHAICPACRGKGSMPPEVAATVARALEQSVSDGPRDSSMPKVGNDEP